MFKGLLFVLAATVAVNATGDFAILHSPRSVVFHGDQEVPQSFTKEVLAASIGLTVKQRSTWDGLAITDLLALPEAAVAVVIEGIDSMQSSKRQRFPLIADEAEETTWQALRERCEESGSDNALVRFSLADGLDALGQSALGELKPTPIEKSLTNLNLNSEEDTKFLEEVQLMHAIAKNVPMAIKSDSKPDIYWFVVSGLAQIVEAHGRNSSATREALVLLNDALDALTKAFVEAYDGNVLVTAFTIEGSQARHARSVVNDGATEKASETIDPKEVIASIATVYDEDYPVIFNIVLWFGIVFFFSLLAICITIADMDPGRDSIIYRMTSNRMKKDN